MNNDKLKAGEISLQNLDELKKSIFTDEESEPENWLKAGEHFAIVLSVFEVISCNPQSGHIYAKSIKPTDKLPERGKRFQCMNREYIIKSVSSKKRTIHMDRIPPAI